MANTTSDEPKAPIVRIRKKRTKKKKDVVHLPVRASRTTRYASLTTPTNPQSKGRECCRTIFASCFKIPVCRTLCFRCILPRCYGGEGSDDDAGEARDEGYHSQNRRSSDITPPIPGGPPGAVGGAEIEMTEMKTTEAVTLVPPPRQAANDYKKHPVVNGSPKHSGAEHEPLTESEVTYIEVENISLSGDPIYIPESNLLTEISEIVNLSGSETVSKENAKASIAGRKPDFCYEDPGKIRVETPTKLPKVVEETTTAKTVDQSEYVECDNFTDESQFYVNEDVLFKPAADSGPDIARPRESAISYANVDAAAVPGPDTLHSRTGTDPTRHSPRASDKKPHEYVNINSHVTVPDPTEERDFVVTGMVKTSSSEFKQLLNKSNIHSVKLPTRVSKSVKTISSPKEKDKEAEKVKETDSDKNKETENKTDKVKVDREESSEYKGDKQTLIKKESNPENDTEVVIDSESDSDKSDGDSYKADAKETDQTKLL